MVVLRHGGVYADLDAECRRPLDGVIASRDTLVAGWDTEWEEPRAALEAGCAPLRLLLAWGSWRAPLWGCRPCLMAAAPPLPCWGLLVVLVPQPADAAAAG